MDADRIETYVGGARGPAPGRPTGRYVGQLAATSRDARDDAVRQLSRSKIIGTWVAATGPMAFLSWVGAPWLADQIGGAESLTKALLLLLTAGLVWQGLLVLVLTRREVGTFQWSRFRDALWLRRPRDPNSGRVGGRIWLWLIPCLVLFATHEFVPTYAPPFARDFAAFLNDDRGKAFFDGAWGWFAVVVVMALFNTVLGEELLFRGYLLPRMQGAFGRWDWVVNGVLFAIYHLHVPWAIPVALLDTFAICLPSRRFRSAWFGIIVHSAQSVVIVAAVLAVVLG